MLCLEIELGFGCRNRQVGYFMNTMFLSRPDNWNYGFVDSKSRFVASGRDLSI